MDFKERLEKGYKNGLNTRYTGYKKELRDALKAKQKTDMFISGLVDSHKGI